MLSKDFKEFVASLQQHEAEYMIVGDDAVGVHGYPRYAGDLDIWLNPTEANASRVLKAIDDFGVGSFKLTMAISPRRPMSSSSATSPSHRPAHQHRWRDLRRLQWRS